MSRYQPRQRLYLKTPYYTDLISVFDLHSPNLLSKNSQKHSHFTEVKNQASNMQLFENVI